MIKRSLVLESDSQHASINPYEVDWGFDLLDVENKNSGFLDNRIKAYFWHRVATHMQMGSAVRPGHLGEEGRHIRGIIGERSGSIHGPTCSDLGVSR
ncbi:hypothetical protein RRF57_001371 [Xylaria bambusicola]|uniref:Uncharacterized protein n=1 Tax=Xylaria bambusicola TaxID=326684 RepID=A0AAN7YUW2_9PEZI